MSSRPVRWEGDASMNKLYPTPRSKTGKRHKEYGNRERLLRSRSSRTQWVAYIMVTPRHFGSSLARATDEFFPPPALRRGPVERADKVHPGNGKDSARMWLLAWVSRDMTRMVKIKCTDTVVSQAQEHFRIKYPSWEMVLSTSGCSLFRKLSCWYGTIVSHTSSSIRLELLSSGARTELHV
jgi:hypothetical protein